MTAMRATRARTVRRRSLAVALIVAAGSFAGAAVAAFTATTASSGNSFTAAASFAGTACTSPTAAWVTGFEHGVISTPAILDSNTGGSIDSAVKRTGNNSLKMVKPATSLRYAYKTVTSTFTATVHFAIRLETLPTAESTLFWLDRLGSDLYFKYEPSTQKFALQWGTDAIVVSSAPVSAATWYSIEVKVATSASPVTADWRVNGVDQTPVSKAETGAAVSRIYFGSLVATTPEAYTANYDDVYYATTHTGYPLGDLAVEALRPNGIGTHVDETYFRHSDGTAVNANTWQWLDDPTMFGGTDQVRQFTAGPSSYLEFTFGDTSATCIHGVQAYGTMGSVSSGNTLKTSVFDGAAETIIHSGSSPCGGCVTVRQVNVPRASGWTQSAVNGLVARIGYMGSSSPEVQWGGLMLEYAAPLPTCATPRTVTPVWLSGFENGRATTSGYVSGSSTATFSNVTTAAGAVALDSTVKRTGAYSLKLVSVTGTAGGAAFMPPSATTSVTRFAIRLDTLPAADVSELYSVLSASNAAIFLGYRASTKKLFIRLRTGSPSTYGPMVESTSTVEAGVWYVVDIKYENGAGTHTGAWRVNGAAQPAASLASAATTLYMISFGSSNTSDVVTANYDDILSSVTPADYPIGDGRIYSLAPDGVTLPASAELQDDDSTAIDATSYTRLDEVPMNSTLDFVKQVTASTGYAEFTFADTSETCIRAVGAASAQAAQLSTATNHGRTSMFDGVAETVVYDGNMAFNTSAVYLRSARVVPNSLPWTRSAVNTLKARVGYSTDVAPAPRWDALRLEYEVGP